MRMTKQLLIYKRRTRETKQLLIYKPRMRVTEQLLIYKPRVRVTEQLLMHIVSCVFIDELKHNVREYRIELLAFSF